MQRWDKRSVPLFKVYFQWLTNRSPSYRTALKHYDTDTISEIKSWRPKKTDILHGVDIWYQIPSSTPFKHTFLLFSLGQCSPVATEALVDLVPPKKTPNPQIETWNTINQWSFCHFRITRPPRTQAKTPSWKMSVDGAEQWCYISCVRASGFDLKKSI